jgi:ferredoxin
MARAAKTWQVRIGNNGQTIACAADETILHAAIMAGIDYPYACASGNCGTCVSQIDTGKVTMLPRSDASLSADQVKAGQTLACRARPKGDVGITWLGRGRR